VRRRAALLGAPWWSLLAGILVAAPALASGGEAGPETVWGLPPLFWKIFNFVLFFGVLGWLLRKPLGQFFRDRREAIAHQLAEATRQHEEAARLQVEVETRIAGLESEISALRERLRQDGERERQALERQGEAEAVRLLAQVEQEASRRVEAARTLLAHEAAETAVALARELLTSELGAADRERIFGATLERLQQTGGQA
jgi:F-type H+-transporting ATPase subunit b